MLKSILGNKMVMLNALTFLVSIAAGLGLLNASDISSDQLEAIAGGLVALIAAANGVAHHRSGSVGVRPGDLPTPQAGSDASNPANPVDPGGA